VKPSVELCIILKLVISTNYCFDQTSNFEDFIKLKRFDSLAYFSHVLALSSLRKQKDAERHAIYRKQETVKESSLRKPKVAERLTIT
jgi:hypothetical protein